eukprot:Nk52_evm5s391 gene=Nk52_evmTU5s391
MTFVPDSGDSEKGMVSSNLGEHALKKQQPLGDEMFSCAINVTDNSPGSDGVKEDCLKGTGALCGESISYRGLYYRVGGKKDRRDILKGVTGKFERGRLHAIMGPTGCGKSTLLDSLAGLKDPRDLEGEIFVNGKPQRRDFKQRSGYVEQEDTVMGTLTVRENLMFSAELRLRNCTQKEKIERVNRIISQLRMEKCADSLVGTEMIRGISGGERKRTSIGMELVIQPGILFLDEPTTGLDSSTALKVLLLLKELTEMGKTVIVAIHQPRYGIFRLFDSLTLMHDGSIVYSGDVDHSLAYFSNLGFECETHNNPADFFLDVLVTNCATAGSGCPDGKRPLGSGEHEERMIGFAKLFQKSERYEAIQYDVDDIHARYHDDGQIDNEPLLTYAQPYLSQLAILCRRAAKNVMRKPHEFAMQMCVSMTMSLLLGGLYFNSNNESDWQTRRSNVSGVFFILIMNMVFSNMSAIGVFIQERNIFCHEKSSGYYHSSTFVFSKIVCDVIPMRCIPLLGFSAISYFMLGFDDNAASYFIYAFTLAFTSITAACACFCFSASVSSLPMATLLMGLSFTIMMYYSGLLLKLSSIPVFLRWLQYLSIVKYSYQGLLLNWDKYDLNQWESEQVLGYYGYSQDEVWVPYVGLGCLSVGFIIITVIQMGRLKRK